MDKPVADTPVAQGAPEFIVLKFADSKIPVFKETKNKDYIKYGEKNNYPEYLTYLFDKSGKHGAIISGKAKYIFGNGFENGDRIVNRLGESLNDIAKKCILDIEIYGGFRTENIWNLGGKVGEIYHVDYSTLRVGKNGGFYWKESWDVLLNREPEEFIPAFDPSCPYGSQIYAYNEYRPMVRFYPLPSYIASNNYVETDIEISKFYLSSIRNGMAPSKMIQFFEGEPTEDKKRAIEKRFEHKFAGSENAGRFILVFNKAQASTGVKIDDLSGSDLDKMFVELNKTCQQEIFSGHQVTSPMLFGIKTEGQLGGNNELQIAYAIFQNTYSKPKAAAFSKEMAYVLGFSSFAGQYELQPTDPIGWQIPNTLLAQAVSPDEVRAKLGLPVLEKAVDTPSAKTLSAISGVSPLVATKILNNLTQNEIRALASLPPLPGGDAVPESDNSGAPGATAVPGADSSEVPIPVNDNIKNLSAKQHQQLVRIIRQYGKGQLTEQQAKTLIRTSVGLSDNDINTMLGIQPVAAATFAEQDDAVIAMFDACGDARGDFEILKSKRLSFDSDLHAEADEAVFIQEAFKTMDVTPTESAIIELIRKDKKITPDVIARTINQTQAYVESKIASLTQKGYLETTTETIGTDKIIERTVPEGLDTPAPPAADKTPPSQVFIKYSYEGPQDSKNRPFCAKMMSLDRLYSRAEIETISQRLGYSVFDRRGGFWTRKGTNDTTPYCRHKWKSNIVVKKGGTN